MDGDTTQDLTSGNATLEALASPSPQQLGRYVIHEELGRGGAGVVHRGWDPELGRAVAIKVLLPSRLHSPSSLLRFHREYRTIARLQHPGIVNVYATGVQGGASWFAMDLIQGVSLAEHLKQGMEDCELLQILFEVASALDYAHAHGVVHRDLKPENVMVTDDGHARIVDFGVAHLEEEACLTRTGEILGTVMFMAPEQILAKPGSIGPATDMWTLGAMLYTALCGRPPFDSDSEVGIMASILRQQPAPPRTLRPDMPKALDRLIRRCLQREPDKRPTAAQATWILSDLRTSWRPRRQRAIQRPVRPSRQRPRAVDNHVLIARGALVTWLGAVALTSYLFGFAAGMWEDQASYDRDPTRSVLQSAEHGPTPLPQLALEPTKPGSK